MKKYCLTLDLKDDAALIADYEDWHKKVWPEILDCITSSGITNMEIYRVSNRLFMIMETDHTFSFEEKSAKDQANNKVQEWEELMWNYQQSLPFAKPGEKWIIMNKIFDLKEQ